MSKREERQLRKQLERYTKQELMDIIVGQKRFIDISLDAHAAVSEAFNHYCFETMKEQGLLDYAKGM